VKRDEIIPAAGGRPWVAPPLPPTPLPAQCSPRSSELFRGWHFASVPVRNRVCPVHLVQRLAGAIITRVALPVPYLVSVCLPAAVYRTSSVFVVGCRHPRRYAATARRGRTTPTNDNALTAQNEIKSHREARTALRVLSLHLRLSTARVARPPGQPRLGLVVRESRFV